MFLQIIEREETKYEIDVPVTTYQSYVRSNYLDWRKQYAKEADSIINAEFVRGNAQGKISHNDPGLTRSMGQMLSMSRSNSNLSDYSTK
jgi:hypothetical protein